MTDRPTTGPPVMPEEPARLSRFARGYVRGYLWIAGVTILASLFALLHPWPLQVLVDHVLGHAPQPGWLTRVRAMLPGASSDRVAAGYVAGVGLVIFALDAMLDVLLTFSWIRVGQRMVYDLSCTLYSRALRRSLLVHLRSPIGDTIARVTGDSWCMYNVAAAVLFTPAHALIVGGTALVLMARMNLALTGVACAMAPVLALTAVYFGGRIQRAKGVERQAESALESHVQRTLSGLSVVQAFVQEEREQRRFVEHAHGTVTAQRRGALAVGASAGTVAIITILATAAVMGFGAHEVIAGRLTLGRLLVFVAYLATLQSQCKALAATYADLRGLRASMDRVRQLLGERGEIRSAEGAAALPAGAPIGVRLDRVTFGYEAGRAVITDVSLDVPAGGTLAIVGPSGAGKSTIASLVLRLFDPWSGSVLAAGRDVREVDLASLRSSVGVVLQEPFLLPRSIAANIALGRSDAPMADIEEAARTAQARGFILGLSEGYDTVLGERGATLSGGERQRIAIARALLGRPSILVLDEAASALDARTEETLMEAIGSLRPRPTTILISHRLSTARRADSIAVMERGRVVERGSHEELLGVGGVYARLWQLQQRHATEASAPPEVSV